LVAIISACPTKARPVAYLVGHENGTAALFLVFIQFLLSHSWFEHRDVLIMATRSWITSTWKFLSDSDNTMIDPFPKPEKACEDDRFLMESFIEFGFRGSELRHLNDCRMHLHALRVSDVCTADGQQLTDDVMEVQPDPHRSSPYSWSRTHRPQYKYRAFWRSALTKVFLHLTDTQVLRQTLRPFSAQVSATWLWQFSPSEQPLSPYSY
jgi:hypothetical protein